jgi:TonB family protein
VATAETSPAPLSIVLETQRGKSTIPVTLTFSAVKEVRELVTRPNAEMSGLLRGRWDGEGIALEHATAAASDADAVGIFRVQPGGWTSLTAGDRKKLKSTGLARGVVLVVRTLARRPWSATLFTVEPDVIGGDAPLAEFPWDEYLLQNGWLVDLALPEPPQARLPRSERPKRSRGWLTAGLVLSIIGAAGAAGYRWLPPLWTQTVVEAPADPPPAPPSPALALRVARQAQDLEVSWDRGSEPVRLATAGTLTIRSGVATRVMEMQPEQLREGRVVFRPLAGVDTDVRLEVLVAGGRSSAESVQVLGFDTAPAVTLPAPAPPPAGAGARKTAQQPGAARPDAPVTAHKASAAAPASATGRGDAVPVKRATPELTNDVIREMRAAKNKVTVSVLVSIDPAGKVDDAKVVSSTGEPSPSGPYIRLASLAAARQWRFRPATADGRSVASQMTLLFTF